MHKIIRWAYYCHVRYGVACSGTLHTAHFRFLARLEAQKVQSSGAWMTHHLAQRLGILGHMLASWLLPNMFSVLETSAYNVGQDSNNLISWAANEMPWIMLEFAGSHSRFKAYITDVS